MRKAIVSARACTSIEFHHITNSEGQLAAIPEAFYRQLQATGIREWMPTTPFIIDRPEIKGEWITREVAARRISDETGIKMAGARSKIDRCEWLRKREIDGHTEFDAGDIARLAQGWSE